MWTDHTSYGFDNWKINEPNNAGKRDEDCAIINLWGEHEWFDAPCDSQNRFICQREKGATGEPGILTVDDFHAEMSTEEERETANKIIFIMSLVPIISCVGIALAALCFWGFIRR